jgi:hypothetical protein
MKKVIFLNLALGCLLGAYAQPINSGKVPSIVMQGFKKVHPNVSATWEWEDANYEANFREGNKSMSCVLDKQGTIIETETMIGLSELPPKARTYVEKNYKGKKVKEVSKIEKAGGQINYEVVMMGRELLFDAAGNFIQVEKEKREKD